MPVGQHKNMYSSKKSDIVTDINNYYIPATLASSAPIMTTAQYRQPISNAAFPPPLQRAVNDSVQIQNLDDDDSSIDMQSASRVGLQRHTPRIPSRTDSLVGAPVSNKPRLGDDVTSRKLVPSDVYNMPPSEPMSKTRQFEQRLHDLRGDKSAYKKMPFAELQRQNNGLELPSAANHQLTMDATQVNALQDEVQYLKEYVDQQNDKINHILQKTREYDQKSEVRLPKALGAHPAVSNRKPECKPKLTDIVPKFTPPAYRWGRQIEETLEMVGYRRPYHPDMQPLVAPQILRECDPELMRLCPKESLEQMIDWLKNFDKNPGLRFPEHELRKRVLTTSPSIYYQRSLVELLDVYERDCLDDYIRETAWRNMVVIMPERLRNMECVINVERFPTENDLKLLDRAYYHNKTVEEVQNKNGISETKVGAIRIEDDEVAALRKKVKELEEKEKQLNNTSAINSATTEGATETKKTPNQNDQKPRQGNGYRRTNNYNQNRGRNQQAYYKPYNNAQQRGGNDNRRQIPDEKDWPVILKDDTRPLQKVEDGRMLCYYHVQYGPKAHYCFGACQHKLVPAGNQSKKNSNNSALHFSNSVFEEQDFNNQIVSNDHITHCSVQELISNFTTESSKHFAKIENLYNQLFSLIGSQFETKPCQLWNGPTRWTSAPLAPPPITNNFKTYAEVKARVLPEQSVAKKIRTPLPMITVLMEQTTKVPFLVDTGAAHSILRPSALSFRMMPAKMQQLLAINNTKIPVLGHVEMEIIIDGKSFQHEFVVADVGFNILGYDFLTTHKIMVEPTMDGPILHMIDGGVKLQPERPIINSNQLVSVVIDISGITMKGAVEDCYIRYEDSSLQTIIFSIGENDKINVLDERVKDLSISSIVKKPKITALSSKEKIGKILEKCANAVDMVDEELEFLTMESISSDDSYLGLAFLPEGESSGESENEKQFG